jgi:hypothetical protein
MNSNILATSPTFCLQIKSQYFSWKLKERKPEFLSLLVNVNLEVNQFLEEEIASEVLRFGFQQTNCVASSKESALKINLDQSSERLSNNFIGLSDSDC